MSRTLEARDLQFAYEEGTPVLRGLSARVVSGQITGFVGPNGSGKSTLLRILCQILRPGAGSVLLDGRPLRSYSNRERARTIAFLPQTINPAFDLTVFEVAALGRYPHLGALGGLTAADADVVRRCLAETHTESFQHRNFLSLSGGERQRVLIASILAQEPALLLLDEPTSALDIHHQVEIFALLQSLAHRGYGVCVVTHDLNTAAQFCDVAYLLGCDGAVLAAGPPEEVFTEARLSEAYDAPIRVARHPQNGSLLISAEPPARVAG
jgi:iron complex transport system ATP-binding protein